MSQIKNEVKDQIKRDGPLPLFPIRMPVRRR